MAFKYREETVGKRFLFVAGCVKLKRNKLLSDFQWKRGVIRASTHKDIKNSELSVLVEYDNVDWKKREWIHVHDQNVFFVEDTLVWAVNKQSNQNNNNILWPALSFKLIYDKIGVAQHKSKPIEYFSDKKLEFVDDCDLKVHHDLDWENYPCFFECPDVKKWVRQWTEFQDGQRILLNTPSVLVGYRVKVYRSEGTTQWYTAVIVSYNENTKQLTLTDDTVLEEHNEDPSLVQMKLIGDGVVESILKGEEVGITPRRRACNQNQFINQLNKNCPINNNEINQVKSSTSKEISHTSPDQHSTSKAKRSSTRRSKLEKRKTNNLIKSNIQTNSKRLLTSNLKTKHNKDSSSDTEVEDSQSNKNSNKIKKFIKKDHSLESDVTNGSSDDESASQPSATNQLNELDDLKNSGKENSISKNKQSNKSLCSEDIKAGSHSSKSNGDQFVGVSSEIINTSTTPENQPIQDKEISNLQKKDIQDNCSEEGSQCLVQNEKINQKVKVNKESKQEKCDVSSMVPTMCLIDEQNNVSKSNDKRLEANLLKDSPKYMSVISSANTTDSPDIKKTSDSKETVQKSNSNSLNIDHHEPVKVYMDPNLLDKHIIRHIDSTQHGLMHPVNSTTSSTATNSLPFTRLPSPMQTSQIRSNSSTTTNKTSSLPSHYNITSSQSLHSNHSIATNHSPANSVDPNAFYRQMLAGSLIPNYNPMDILWQQKNFSQHLPSQLAASTSASQWAIFTEQMRAQMSYHSEHDLQAKEKRLEREKQEEKEKLLISKTDGKEQIEKEKRVFQEQMDKEEKERRQREAVQQHFEESLRLAQQKKQIGWSPISNLPLTKTQTSSAQSFTIANQHNNVKTSHNLSHNSRELERDKVNKEALINERKIDTERWIAFIQQQQQQQQGNFIVSKEDKKLLEMAHYQHSLPKNQSIKVSAASPIAEQISQQTINQRAKGEPSFSLYGYQPTQLSYITHAQLKETGKLNSGMLVGPNVVGTIHKTPPTAHNLDKRESPMIDRSITPSSRNSTPIGRPPSLSPKHQKFIHERVSPIYQRNQSNNSINKPYDYSSNNAPPAHQNSSLNRFETSVLDQPQNLVKIETKSRQPQNLVNSQNDNSKVTHLTSKPLYPHNNLVQQGLVPNPIYTAAPTNHSSTSTCVISDLSKQSKQLPLSKSNFTPSSSTNSPGIVSGIPICRFNNVYYHEGPMLTQQKYSHNLPSNIKSFTATNEPLISNVSHNSLSQISQSNSTDKNITLIQRSSHSPRVFSVPVSSPYGPPPGMNLHANASLSQTSPPAAHSGISPINLDNKRKNNDVSLVKKQKVNDAANNNSSNVFVTSNLQSQSPLSLSKQSERLSSENSLKNINTIDKSEMKSQEFSKSQMNTCDIKTENVASKQSKLTSISSDIKVEVKKSENVKKDSPSPSPSNATSFHPKLKKAWLQRHSYEDKNVTTIGIKSSNTKTTDNVMNCSKDEKPKNDITNGEIKEDSKNKINDNEDDETSSSSETEQELNKSDKSKSPRNTRKRNISVKEKSAKKRKSGSDNGKSDELSKSGKENDEKKKKEKNNKDSEKESLRLVSKRGRKPKLLKNDEKEKANKETSNKKKKENQKTKIEKNELKKSGAPFLQGGSCVDVAPKLPKCRECRMTATQRNRKPTIFCRFYDYRKLAYKNNALTIAGFSQPQDATEEDLKLWLPSETPSDDLDIETAKFLLTHVGDQFCDLVKQEKEAQVLHNSTGNKTITWKRVVQGVREMCDVCETTLFNIHWVCDKCGFVVCIDCYKSRTIGSVKEESCTSKDRDGFQWLLCNNRQQHEPQKLEVTQIIAASALSNLGKMLHSIRIKWSISYNCSCTNKDPNKRSNGFTKQVLNVVKMENKQINGANDNSNKPWKIVNGALNAALIKQESDLTGYSSESGNSPLSFFADVALTSEKLMSKNSSFKDGNDFKSNKKNNNENNEETDEVNEDDEEAKHSTLRELLMGPTSKNTKDKMNGSPIVNSESSIGKEIKEDIKPDEKESPLQHFTRRVQLIRRIIESPPIVSRKLDETKKLYPNVLHSWFCNGKLLVLHDPNNKNNIKLFQEQWIRGQPIIVKDIHKSLNQSLWHPDSFSRDFGDIKNDLVNCKNGDILTKQPMKKFWDGFESIQNRIKEKDGSCMLLKLKDWPPDEEFSELLPTRYKDLMNSLPLPEYTSRNGVLNLAGRLPECFVRPDLGPKMYSAYGSALHPDKGTTNLHIDISDAVNVLIFVGIPKETNKDWQQDALNAVDNGGCDEIMRKRVREKGVKLGALWHIYNAKDADKIRDLLNKVANERGEILEPHHDPIHDQSWYLDEVLRERLLKEYGVEGYSIAQCLGDAIFIPAGAPHQVRNLHSCIKVAGDFVSPENVAQCFNLTQEFRQLSEGHNNHEDKLQIKNIIYHAVKDALSSLWNYQPENTN